MKNTYINFVIVPFLNPDCVLDSTAVTCCKTLDIANGSKRKTSVILKRGRTILKNRCDSKKHSLRNSLSNKMITNAQDLHKLKPEDINITTSPYQNGFGLSPDSSLAIVNTTPSAKKAIQLEDKLISGDEIEICPAFRIDNRRTECIPDETDAHLNENSRQAKISRDESSKLYLNSSNFESNKFHSSTDKSPIIAEDYPKLYVTVTNISDKEMMAKNSLLKNIRSIQNADRDAYGINISNSRFFVPKDYVFSGVECVMNDLKFEVDPEMGKLLQRSYSNPQISTNSPALIDIESNPSSLDNTISSETSIALNNSSRQRNEESNSKYLRTLSDTSLVNLKLKESDKIEQRQKLFLNKRESKPSHEVINSVLGETTSKSETSAALQIKNRIESSNKLDDHVNLHESEKKSRKMKCENCKFFPSKVSHSRNEIVKQETCLTCFAVHNQLWTAKHVNIDDEKITAESAADILEESKTSGLSDKNVAVNINSLKFEKIKSPYDTLKNTPLMRSKSYPLISSSKVSSASRCLSSISVIPSCQTLKRISSENEKKNSEPFKYSSIDQKNQIELSSCNKGIKESENSNLRETNRIRLNRMKFLQGSLQAAASENENSQIEKVAPSESMLFIINETSQNIDSESDRYKDQPLPMGRTSSLREKFETIMEDVELRTTSGRHSQISKSCDRKSLC